MITQAGLDALRSYFAGKIRYAAYYTPAGSMTADVQSVEIQADSSIAVTFPIQALPYAGGDTITMVSLTDANGTVLVAKEENISLDSLMNGTLYRFQFTITEG